jgi:hypothetical protein
VNSHVSVPAGAHGGRLQPRHGSGPSMGAALRAAPLSLSQTFRICASSPGQRDDQRWREGKLKAQSSLLRGEPRES